MSIKTLRESSKKAKQVIASKVNEDAATVTQLTTGPKNASTVFVIKDEGVNINQVKQEVRSKASPSSRVEQTGNNITITTNNPRAVVQILKNLKISATVQGDVLNQQSDNKKIVESVARTIENNSSFSLGNGLMICTKSLGKSSKELRDKFLTFYDEKSDTLTDEADYWTFVKTYGCVV